LFEKATIARLTMPEQILIENKQSPGDYLVLTAALRDICLAYPNKFQFGIRVFERSIYQYNPYVDLQLHRGRVVAAKYPMVHKSNSLRLHFMWGFLDYLNQQLGTKAVLTDFRPFMRLHETEVVEPPCGVKKPYWVFASGGKKDYTAKIWDPVCWDKVVTELAKQVPVVQVGGGSHMHTPIPNTINLVGKTSFRELIRLIYHSEGVMCVVTCLMHIAAALNKPCVVVAGGREPYWWEAYTEESRLVSMRHGKPDWKPPINDDFIPHKFLHTISTAPGSLDTLNCCFNKGCWKSRIGVKKPSDRHSVCTQQVTQNGVVIPACLQKITPEHVLAGVQWYYDKGIISRKTPPTLIVTIPEELPPKPLNPVTPKPVVRSAAGEVHLYEGDIAGLRSEAEKLQGVGWVAIKQPTAVFRFDDWETRLAEELVKKPNEVFGMIIWSPISNQVAKQLTRPGPLHPLNSKMPILYHPLTSWVVLPSDLLPRLPWDSFETEDKDVQLGVWLYNAGVRLRDGAWLLRSIKWPT
jgi:hypothetical protein